MHVFFVPTEKWYMRAAHNLLQKRKEKKKKTEAYLTSIKVVLCTSFIQKIKVWKISLSNMKKMVTLIY